MSIFRICFILLLLSTAHSNVYAEEDTGGHARGAVGISGGAVFGNGLTYRYYFSHAFVQGTFFGRVNSLDNVSNLLGGVSYGHVLSEIKIVKFLPPTALILISGVDGRYTKPSYVDETSSTQQLADRTINAGAGIAIEVGNTFSPGLLLSIGTAYAFTFEKINNSWQWNLGPQVNLGMLYNW